MPDSGDSIKTPPVVDDLAGRRVGRFLVQDRIGAGGMGHVYRAEDTSPSESLPSSGWRRGSSSMSVTANDF